jgi:hypothetical protein
MNLPFPIIFLSLSLSLSLSPSLSLSLHPAGIVSLKTNKLKTNKLLLPLHPPLSGGFSSGCQSPCGGGGGE